MDYKINHNNLPEAITMLLGKVDHLLILIESNNSDEDSKDQLLDIEHLIDYLPERPARQTIYQWASMRRVPYEKHGKRLYFRKSAIDTWLANGRQIK